MNLKSQKIVVMGGSSGIGLASARALANLGAEVTVTGRDAARLRAVAEGAPSLRTAVVDATAEDAVKRFYAEYGVFNHLVITLSGAKGGGPFSEVSADTLREGFEAKVFAHWRAAQNALVTLAKDGSITFVSAASARASTPGTAGLAAINGAIEAMIKPLARELKPRRVNAVSPGVIETPWWERLPADQRQTLLATTASMALVGRNGTAEEVAQAIVYVVTNGFVTGSVLEVDGGIRLG